MSKTADHRDSCPKCHKPVKRRSNTLVNPEYGECIHKHQCERWDELYPWRLVHK